MFLDNIPFEPEAKAAIESDIRICRDMGIHLTFFPLADRTLGIYIVKFPYREPAMTTERVFELVNLIFVGRLPAGYDLWVGLDLQDETSFQVHKARAAFRRLIKDIADYLEAKLKK